MEEHDANGNEQGYTHYNPIEVTVSPDESLGAIFLGLMSIVLLIAFLRAQKQIRSLQERMARLEAERAPGERKEA